MLFSLIFLISRFLLKSQLYNVFFRFIYMYKWLENGTTINNTIWLKNKAETLYNTYLGVFPRLDILRYTFRYHGICSAVTMHIIMTLLETEQDVYGNHLTW